MKVKKHTGHADLDPLCTDIVYIIHYTNGQMYIGKKTVQKYVSITGIKDQN